MSWLNNAMQNGFVLKLWPFYLRMEIERADGDEEVNLHCGWLKNLPVVLEVVA